MIGRIQGILIEKSPPAVMVDVQGLGYCIDVPMSSFYELPAIGEKVTLLTEFIVREDAQLLYGFLTAAEREAFRLLIRISGVGPRTALSVLSGLSADDLAQAVAAQDSSRLMRVPGIGKKTAERLMLELRGKFSVAPVASAGTGVQDDRLEVQRALMALGYSEKESAQAIHAIAPGTNLSEGIRQALKQLSKGSLQ
ncbi:MAG: Holliday junction branch migration protein RuvA [Betaproteobacteria bacterium]|nr:Holliday junction branch migration protein RuvA [Pseudomonadota bacterium]NBO11959.1 Holliday junction branch migration protein RuvA [Betaproteobacteria bacterium]NBO44043.1 Holliday junction branch migration protein RuvA [Betaproteobacteria bacterium]NBP10020.1 Holliday junction branch migration protein RuvA [Betaproteobacteria bacterium]NBP61342.1 Holliday junction branch migration protein RuvA [Betaproteobacteria bacterium]